MKLNEYQLKEIETYLKKDDIFYDDIRNEMADHIASALEENPAQADENFGNLLASYMNSHNKVKLLTAAREQEAIRDRKYKKYFLKQFFTLHGILLMASASTIVYFSGMNTWTEKTVDLLLIAAMCITAWYTKPLKRKFPFIFRMTANTAFYYMILILMATQLSRFNGLESNVISYTEKIATAIIFTGYILMFKTNNHFKKQSYA